MLGAVLSLNLFAFFLVFARLGTAMMLMPGFGETNVAPRMRLVFALGLTLVVLPVVAQRLPRPPADGIGLFVLLGGEMVVGLFLGTVMRLMMAALQVAGSVAASEMGLSSVLAPDFASSQQGAIAGSFLVVVALVLVFASNLHHLMLTGVLSSYGLFTPGELPPFGDFADAISHAVSRSFLIGIQMAAPFIVVGLLLSIGMGILSRLMPQVQIFFIVTPLQITLGLLVFAAVLAAIMAWFISGFEDMLAAFTSPL
ncbi:MAG: flagellar biosynthetic protein FliR [Alphaproteobacteria bacterium]